eukprot:8077449-Pyramimonas_sp.AAC.1
MPLVTLSELEPENYSYSIDFSTDAFSTLLLLFHALLHETAPSRAQCEIAAPELHEEALRVPFGSLRAQLSQLSAP